MTEVVDRLPQTRRPDDPEPRTIPPRTRARSAEADLTEAVCGVLDASLEPLTPAKIRALLPGVLRRVEPESLAETLHRQVEAGVLFGFCPYRSQQPRFWRRPLADHVAVLIRSALTEGPLTWSQLLRKLPEYALPRAEEVLQAQLAGAGVHRHPGGGPRGGERYGLTPPDPRGPLRLELARVFERLGKRLGLSETQLRAAALEVLQDEEWGSPREEASSEPRYQE